MSTRILYATSEMYPLVKTGGLADVSFALPAALAAEGQDVRVILPAYTGVAEKLSDLRPIADIEGFVLPENGVLLEGRLEAAGLTVWLVDIPHLFQRSGGPYCDEHGEDYPDNCQRFACFSRVVMEIALGHIDVSWQAEIVHCNDWQTALVPAYMSFHQGPPVLFTIHNLAYQGIFPADQFSQLVLPDDWFTSDKLEFHGNVSLLKAGVIFSDWVTTVSARYAQEILTPEFGFGFDGLLRHNQYKLSGILNGVDLSTWDPLSDAFIAQHYDAASLPQKNKNKLALQTRLGLPEDKAAPLFGIVSRFVYQKGIDQVVETIEALADRKIQWAILGRGDRSLEQALINLSEKLEDKVALVLDYDEQLAHQIVSGADFFVMPSRYEPCGLNQMYAMRYGALPVVTRVGGLADTVVEYQPGDTEPAVATGFVIDHCEAVALTEAVRQAAKVFRSKKIYRKLQSNGMACDFGWQSSSRQYLEMYEKLLQLKEEDTPTVELDVVTEE